MSMSSTVSSLQKELHFTLAKATLVTELAELKSKSTGTNVQVSSNDRDLKSTYPSCGMETGSEDQEDLKGVKSQEEVVRGSHVPLHTVGSTKVEGEKTEYENQMGSVSITAGKSLELLQLELSQEDQL